MTEFLISLSLAVLGLAGTAAFLHAQWNRSRCAYLVFENVHARLIGDRESGFPSTVSLSESQYSVEGSARCGAAFEKLRLPRLEHAPW